MTELSHDLLTNKVIHPPHRWEFSNETTRLAATNFTTQDLKKVAVDLDTWLYYVLTSISPITWKPIKSPGMLDTYFSYVSGMTKSESNLRATSIGTWKYADLAGFKTSGKWFIEFENLVGDGWAGPINPDYNAGYGYERGQSIHVVNNYPTLGVIYNNNAYVGPIGSGLVNWVVGSYLGIGYDVDTGEVKVYINGALKATHTISNPAYRPAKMTFSYCAMSTNSARVIPNANSVHYPIPSGYTYFGQSPS